MVQPICRIILQTQDDGIHLPQHLEELAAPLAAQLAAELKSFQLSCAERRPKDERRHKLVWSNQVYQQSARTTERIRRP